MHSRRRFLASSIAAGSGLALASCGGASPPVDGPTRAAVRIRAVAFDLFTVFDPRSIDRRVVEILPAGGAAFGGAWRARAFEYAFIRAAGGRYLDFRQVVADALSRTARAEGLTIDAATSEALIASFEQLDPWPDSREVLAGLRADGHRLVTLANFAPEMVTRLLAHAGLSSVFDLPLSTAAARTFKPDPRAYQLAVDALGLPREEIAFSAFGGWDAAGASWFGFPTFWVNRLGVVPEELGASFATGSSLTDLRAWLSRR